MDVRSAPPPRAPHICHGRALRARRRLLTALNRHAKHRREDIERLCLELHAEIVAYEQEMLQVLEDVVGQKSSKKLTVENIMREHGIEEGSRG